MTRNKYDGYNGINGISFTNFFYQIFLTNYSPYLPFNACCGSKDSETFKFPTIKNGRQLLSADWAVIIIIFEELKSSNKIIANKYLLKYPKKFDGPKLLNEYILFTNDITINDFISNLEINIEYKINQLEIKKKTISNSNLVDNEIENLKLII